MLRVHTVSISLTSEEKRRLKITITVKSKVAHEAAWAAWVRQVSQHKKVQGLHTSDR